MIYRLLGFLNFRNCITPVFN